MYEFLYTKNDRFGFSEEQDLKILEDLYPNARDIRVIFSVPGEAHFVLTYWQDYMSEKFLCSPFYLGVKHDKRR